MASAIEEIITDIPRLSNLATRERFLDQLKEAINHFTEVPSVFRLPKGGFHATSFS